MNLPPSRFQNWARPAFFLGHNWITLLGAVLTTSAAITLIGYWLRESVRDTPTHPYAGILFFFALPGVFILGLLLMPLGVWWHRRRLRGRGELPGEWPQVDLGAPIVRHAVMLVAIAVEDSVEIVAEPRRMMNIANGLAAAGVPHIADMLRDGNQDPIWNLSEALVKLLTP